MAAPAEWQALGPWEPPPTLATSAKVQTNLTERAPSGTVVLERDGEVIWEDPSGTYSGQWSEMDDGRVKIVMGSVTLLYTEEEPGVMVQGDEFDMVL